MPFVMDGGGSVSSAWVAGERAHADLVGRAKERELDAAGTRRVSTREEADARKW